jgi:hypothetical protein
MRIITKTTLGILSCQYLKKYRLLKIRLAHRSISCFNKNIACKFSIKAADDSAKLLSTSRNLPISSISPAKAARSAMLTD